MVTIAMMFGTSDIHAVAMVILYANSYRGNLVMSMIIMAILLTHTHAVTMENFLLVQKFFLIS